MRVLLVSTALLTVLMPAATMAEDQVDQLSPIIVTGVTRG